MSVTNIKTTVEAVVEPYIVALEQKYKDILDNTTNMLTSYQSQIQQMSDANTAMQNTVNTLFDRVNEMAIIVDKCNKVVEEAGILDLTETNNNINSIKEQLITVAGDITENSNRILNVTSNVEQNSAAITGIRTNIDTLDTKLTNTANRIDSINSTTNTLRNSVETLSNNVVSLGNTVNENNTNVNNKINSVKDDIIDINNSITNINTDIRNLSSTVTNNKTATDEAIMHLQEQLDNM